MSLLWLLAGAALLWVLYAHAGHPALMWLLARWLPRPTERADITPSVSLIIAVHNGENSIRAKLENCLALDYPGPLEIVVASDGSTDRTHEIAEGFADAGVILVSLAERQGKEAAQGLAIRRARGEVLAFTDVDARLDSDALRALVRPFADPSIGCVSSEDVVEERGGEAAYVRFEMALRRLESTCATLAGLSGSLFAARRVLCDPWPTDLASDFRTALEAARRGLRAVAEPGARVRFGTVRDATGEWQRKVRTVRRGLAVLAAYRGLLHPRHGRAALVLWGHKVARFTAPFALLVLLVASAALALGGDAWGGLLLAAQVAAYGTGAVALRGAPGFLPARIAAYFLLVNASILAAWSHHVRGERATVWQPSAR